MQMRPRNAHKSNESCRVERAIKFLLEIQHVNTHVWRSGHDERDLKIIDINIEDDATNCLLLSTYLI